MKKIIATCLPLSVALMASTALAAQPSQTVKLVPYNPAQTTDLNALCNHRDSYLRDKHGLTTEAIKKLNTFQTESAKIDNKAYKTTQKQYVNFSVCMQGIFNYIVWAVPEIEKSKSQELAHKAFDVIKKKYQLCKPTGNSITMPHSFEKYSQDQDNKLEGLSTEYLTSTKLKQAIADPYLPDINICNAIKNKTLSKKDAIVTQLRPE